MHANSNFGSTSCPFWRLLLLPDGERAERSEVVSIVRHSVWRARRRSASGIVRQLGFPSGARRAGYYIFKVVVAIGTRLDIAAARLQIDIRLMGWA